MIDSLKPHRPPVGGRPSALDVPEAKCVGALSEEAGLETLRHVEISGVMG